jgi:hypothetical protein
MTEEEIRDLVSQAAELGALNVVFTGGEPTMLGPKLPRLLHFIKHDTPIQSTRLVTNGKWARTADTAREHLEKWKDAGLDEINISCGEYHQEFVPLEHVAIAYREACRLGFRTVVLAGEFLKRGHGKLEPKDFYRAVGETLVNLDTMSPYADDYRGMQCGAAMRFGRGKHFVPLADVIKYPEEHHKSRCFDVLQAVTAHPNGNVTACCGVMVREESLLNMGNWRTSRLRTILEAGHNDRVLNWIRYLGLKDMKRWLQSKDSSLNFSNEFTSICDMCAEMVYDRRCQEILLTQGHERDNDIIANKIAVDAVSDERDKFTYQADGSPLPAR